MKVPRHLILLIIGLGVATMTNASAVNSDARPLPTADELLQRVVEQSQNENANDKSFRNRYHYTRVKATEYRNGDGELKKRDEKKQINRPKPAPVPAAVLVSDLLNGGDGTTRPLTVNSNSTSFDKKELLLSTNLLNRFQFTVAGREVIDGRPAVIVDFKPKDKKLPEPTLKDRFLNKAAGRVWVDEAEAVLVKANVHLTEKVTLLGGLVGAVHKFSCSFGRERTDEGLWFTRLAKWHLEGREVIVNRTIDFEEKKTDVKKAW